MTDQSLCLRAEQDILCGSEHLRASVSWHGEVLLCLELTSWVIAMGEALGLHYVVCSVPKPCKKTISIITTFFPFSTDYI